MHSWCYPVKIRDLTPLLCPESVAVIGASTNLDKPGGTLFKNLVEGGYAGRLYPVNPRATSVMGHQSYVRITEIPEAVDLAFIVIPHDSVKASLEQCATNRARACCIVASGFAEVGETGHEEQEELRALAQTRGVLTVGPNTIGLVNAAHRLMGTFIPFSAWQSGGVAIFAQTGIFAGAPMLQIMSQESQRLGIGVSLDVGNKVDVDEVDFLHFVSNDPGTRVIGLHLEGMGRPRTFLELASRVKQKKPVVVLKPGRSRAGAEAAASHTGSMTIEDDLLDSALRQYGLVRADDVDDFLSYLKAFATMPLPRGRRLGIVTYSGALGVVAADEAAAAGLELAGFATETATRLAKVLPVWHTPRNPADVWMAVELSGSRDGHEVPLDAVLADPHTDMVLGILLVPPGVDFGEVRQVFAGLRTRHPDKPLCLVLYGGTVRDRWLRELEGLDIPAYPSTRAAIRALRALAEYAERRDRNVTEVAP